LRGRRNVNGERPYGELSAQDDKIPKQIRA
jgi:hypothetical protein